MAKMLSEVIDQLKSSSFKIRLINANNNKFIKTPVNKIVNSKYANNIEVTDVALNELFMTYDIKIKVRR